MNKGYKLFLYIKSYIHFLFTVEVKIMFIVYEKFEIFGEFLKPTNIIQGKF